MTRPRPPVEPPEPDAALRLPEPWLPDWLDGIAFMLVGMAFAGSMALLGFCSVSGVVR